MLRKLRIGHRLIALIAIQALVLIITSMTALAGLNFALDTTGNLNEIVSDQARLGALADWVRGDVLGTINDIERGKTTWEEARENLATAWSNFDGSWAEYIASAPRQGEGAGASVLAEGGEALEKVFTELDEIFTAEDRARLALYTLNDLDAALAPFLQALQSSITAKELAARRAFQESIRKSGAFRYSALGVAVFGILVAGVLGFVIYRSITFPIAGIASTVSDVSEGNYYARTQLEGDDELAQLGQAFDGLLEERVTSLVRSTEENEKLNSSVLSILRAVSQLGRGDLTTEAPVNEDITGALGDAINQMSEGIAKTLAQVNGASTQVVAGARKAHETTAQSRETVLGTVRGMNEIRTTIQETAKRIKRLGERSQEIGGIVKLIDTIAERTNVLALNANMQAAQAGEAGRGFMVVAAEVQRLAESAKEATDQIAKLISGIQVETGEAISTMDRSIEEVVEGSRLAEKGATEMSFTDEAVEALNALGAQLQEAVRAFKLPAGYIAQDDTDLSVQAAVA